MSHSLENLDETLVAPQEMRELLVRLTESSVEAIPLDQPRTLAAFAAETGIPIDRLRQTLDGMRSRPRWHMALALVGGVAVAGLLFTSLKHAPVPVHLSPPLVTAPFIPTKATYDQSGLVPLTQVTFGPDAATQQVDPSFEPTIPIQPGISVTATVDPIMWGSGDHRAAAIHEPLTAKQAQNLRASIEELLQHVRKHALARKMPISSSQGYMTPGLTYNGAGFSISIGIYSYNGITSVGIRLPPTGTDDAEAAKLVKKAAAKSVDQLQDQLRWMHDAQQNDSGR